MRTLTEILTDEMNAANPIVLGNDFDSLGNDNITQYCLYMDMESEYEAV